MKHKTRCLTITVRFNKPGLQGQRISHNEGPIATQYIDLEHDALRLSLNFKNAQGMTLKQLNFNSNDVTEYDCESVMALPPAATPFQGLDDDGRCSDLSCACHRG